MKNKLILLKSIVAMFSVSFACAAISDSVVRKYETPPSSSTSANVPYISDEAMEECVKIYNKAKWLSEEMQHSQVDNYNQKSVDDYNLKVTEHSVMIDYFNEYCAGKQSESAYRAAQKLNQQGNN